MLEEVLQRDILLSSGGCRGGFEFVPFYWMGCIILVGGRGKIWVWRVDGEVGLILPVLRSMASLFPVRGSVAVSEACWIVARVPELI